MAVVNRRILWCVWMQEGELCPRRLPGSWPEDARFYIDIVSHIVAVYVLVVPKGVVVPPQESVDRASRWGGCIYAVQRRFDI